MRGFQNREEGNVIITVAISLAVLMGFAALGVDVGAMYTARNQLQAAVDSAALAGASGLLVSESVATTRAIQFAALNRCINQPVTITAAQNISFPVPNTRIRVQATRVVNTWFARVLGMNTVTINAMAEAEIAPLSGTPGMKPWAIPDTIPSMYELGEQVVLKAGALGAPGTSPGFFYPVDFPPVNRGNPISGGDEYRENIITGADEPVYIGDELMVEPGNMIGPTKQGFQDLIAMDPNATWNQLSGGTGYLSNSLYTGFSSPRIVKIPFYDYNIVPDSGRNTVTVIALGAFFVERLQGNDIIGRFIEITTPGVIGGGGGGSSALMGVHLVQ